MRICVVNDHFSSGLGGHHRIQNLAKGLSELGHDVTYVCHYGVSKNLSELDISKASVRQSLPMKNAILSYINDFVPLYKKLTDIASSSDFVIVELPNTMNKSINSVLLRSKNILVSNDFAGLWTSLLDKSYGAASGSSRVLRPFAQIYEDLLTISMGRYPVFSTAATTNLANLVKKLTGRDTFLIPHPVNEHFFNVNARGDATTASIPQKFRNKKLIMLGIYDDESFMPIIRGICTKPFFRSSAFLAVGDFPRISAHCKKIGLDDNIFFVGKIPNDIMPNYISLVDFTVVLTPEKVKAATYAPRNISKVGEYLAMGKPVITDTLALDDYVSDGSSGFICQDENAISYRIESLLQEPDQLKRLGDNASREAAERLHYKKVAQRYVDLVQRICHI